MGTRNGYWSLVVNEQNGPGQYVRDYPIFETPLDVGHWHDVKMQMNWSTGIKTGWVRLWLNGVRQTFFDGSDTAFLSTLVPGTTTCYYKEGYYRQAMQPTGMVTTPDSGPPTMRQDCRCNEAGNALVAAAVGTRLIISGLLLRREYPPGSS